MLLGILLHAAIPYLHMRFPAWPVQDTHQSRVFDVNLFAVHEFRMQLFFLLAGFFGASALCPLRPPPTAISPAAADRRPAGACDGD